MSSRTLTRVLSLRVPRSLRRSPDDEVPAVAGTRQDAGVPFGFAVPTGAAAVAVACLCAGALAPEHPARVWLPGVTVAAVAYLCRDWRAALSVAAVAFLFVDGFLENRAGELSWHPGDLERLGLLAALALAGTACGAVVSAVGRHRERTQQLAVIEAWANTPRRAATDAATVRPARPGGAA
jgi:hypothetical protein